MYESSKTERVEKAHSKKNSFIVFATHNVEMIVKVDGRRKENENNGKKAQISLLSLA